MRDKLKQFGTEPNKLKRGVGGSGALGTCMRLVIALNRFFDAHKPVSPLPRSRRCVRWVPPPLVCYNTNVDATMFETSDCTGIGVVFQDHEGCISTTLSQRVCLTQSVEMAKALAARRAVIFAKELSLSNVLVEGDCLRVV